MMTDVLIGCWQGVGLWYAVKHRDFAVPVGFGIAAKLFVEYVLFQDVIKSTTSALATILGTIITDFVYNNFQPPKHRKNHSLSQSRKPSHREVNGHTHRHRSRRTVSDITSVDSSSELIGPRGLMSPLERDIAALRARASLADSERRRFKEERKWAIAQGNLALAAQMKWEVKRYAALMKSFHREADSKIVEASRSRVTRLPQIEEHRHVPSGARSGSRNVGGMDVPTVSVDIAPSQLKSAIRVNVR